MSFAIFPISSIGLSHIAAITADEINYSDTKKSIKSLKQKPLRSEINVFKSNLINLLDKISLIEKRPKDESEEHLKNDLRDFLRETYYRDTPCCCWRLRHQRFQPRLLLRRNDLFLKS
jgi:hypothetical protein